MACREKTNIKIVGRGLPRQKNIKLKERIKMLIQKKNYQNIIKPLILSSVIALSACTTTEDPNTSSVNNDVTGTDVITQSQTDTETNSEVTESDTDTSMGSTNSDTDTQTNETVDPTDTTSGTDTDTSNETIDPLGVEINGAFLSANSSEEENLPENVYDNDDTTRWSAESVNGEAQWLQFEFTETKTIAGLDIAFHKGDERTTTFDIVVSQDGVTWTTLYSGMSGGLTEELEYFDVENTDTKLVRIIGYGNSDSDWNSINEVEIYFDEDKDDTTPTETETETETATATATLTATETATDTQMETDFYPSDIVPGIVDWKITLPVDSNGEDSTGASSVDDRNNNATEIKDDNLIGYEYLPYFYASDEEIFFRAHAGGATTSGSKYPRSE